MRCPTCQQPMLAQFTTVVCDHCDGMPEGDFFRGWVVWPAEAQARVQTWVFRTEADARRWLKRRTGGSVRAVLSPQPFAWTRSKGGLKDVVVADHPFEIYPDHRHPPGDRRAFLAPPSTPDADRVRLKRL